MSDRLGDYMQVHSGGKFWPLDPRPEEISILDVAAALSKQCRYSGHTSRFYSVAQHCVLVARQCQPENQLVGLLHDAQEAYLVDLPRPLKNCLGFETYRWAEERLEDAIAARFGYTLPRAPEVKKWDTVLLATEVRDLMPGSHDVWDQWIADVDVLAAPIQPWSAPDAESLFLAEFIKLGRQEDVEEVMVVVPSFSMR